MKVSLRTEAAQRVGNYGRVEQGSKLERGGGVGRWQWEERGGRETKPLSKISGQRGQVLELLILLALLLLNDIVCATDDQGGQVAVGKVLPLLVILVL